MRKQPGKGSRHRPSFDCLEERSLLSAEYLSAAAPEVIATVSQVPALQPGPVIAVRLDFNGGLLIQEEQGAPVIGPPLPGQMTRDATPEPQAGSLQAAGEGGPVIVSGAPIGRSASEGGAGVLTQSSAQLVSSSGLPPGAGPVFAVAGMQSGAGQLSVFVTGNLAFAFTRSPFVTVEPEPTILDPVYTQAGAGALSVGVESVAGKPAGPEPGGMSSELVVAPASPPPQQLTLLASSAGTSARLVSQADAVAGGYRSMAAGPCVNTGLASGMIRRGLKLIPGDSDRLLRGRLEELAGPMSADLIAGAFPLDRVALGRAIDQFFEQFEDRDTAEFLRQDPRHLVILLLAVASTLLALETVRRRSGRPTATRGVSTWARAERNDYIEYPALNGSWPSRLS